MCICQKKGLPPHSPDGLPDDMIKATHRLRIQCGEDLFKWFGMCRTDLSSADHNHKDSILNTIKTNIEILRDKNP